MVGSLLTAYVGEDVGAGRSARSRHTPVAISGTASSAPGAPAITCTPSSTATRNGEELGRAMVERADPSVFTRATTVARPNNTPIAIGSDGCRRRLSSAVYSPAATISAAAATT